MDWLANNNPPWSSYREFMYEKIIELDKLPGVHTVGVGEMWRLIFANEATHACKDDQLCAGLKSEIDGTVHGVQYI